MEQSRSGLILDILRDSLCALLSFLPGVGFFGFLHMGRRSGRTLYTQFGLLYAALTALILLSGSGVTLYIHGFREATCNRLLSFYMLSPIRTGNLSPNSLPYQLADAISTTYTLLYAICFLHTQICLRSYLKYMRQAVHPYEQNPAPMMRFRWLLVNHLWLLWAFLPLVNGLALHFEGTRLGRRRLRNAGLGFVLASVLLQAGKLYCDLVPPIAARTKMPLYTIAPTLLPVLHCLCFLLAFLYRRECLQTLAARWQSDTSASPKYASLQWRVSNSGWHVFAALPVIGGAGLVRASVHCADRRLRVQGVCLLVLNTFLLALVNLTLMPHPDVQDTILMQCIPPLQAICFYIACLRRRDVLLQRAENLGEYASDLDREIAQQRRYHRRAQTPEFSENSRTPEPPPPPPASPGPERGQTVDLNTCSQAEMAALPGLSLADVKRALEYRQTHNGFRSVDEFVDVLSIKPHFAVQIFQLASTSQPAPEPEPQNKDEAKRPHRRALDL